MENFDGGHGRFGGSRPRRFDGPRGPRNFDGPREMHKATCSGCQAECEVPFKPTEGRPVYCRDCFKKNKKF